jgi:hypothetical protein
MRQNIAMVMLLLLMLARTVCADIFQDQIARSFPGFVIMSSYEFEPDIQKNLDTNPAFVIRKFNDDDFEDFAALIRGKDKKRYIDVKGSYDYFELKLVVCHGLGGKRYTCQELLTTVTAPPEFHYLMKHSPGKINCDLPGSKDPDIKTDSIDWKSSIGWASETKYVRYFYQRGGSYSHCTIDY